MSEILRVTDLVKRFGGNRAVDGASFAVEEGTITALIGPNGAGKTTCFNCISGFLRINGGTVEFEGARIDGLSPHRIVRRGVVRTFQIPQELSSMTVLENCMLGTGRQLGERLWEPLFRPWRVNREERGNEVRAREILGYVNLGEMLYERAGNLSGGQKKLLELARALITRPKLVLLDEPAAGVNPTLALQLVDHIRRLQRDLAVTFLIVEHNMEVVMRVADTVVVMSSGRVLTEGTPDEVVADVTVQQAYLGSQYR